MNELYGPISYTPRTLLRLDRRVLEAEEISPEALHTFVMRHASDFNARIDFLHGRDLSRARHPDTQQPPALHIIRLADREWARAVFKASSLGEAKTVTTSPDSITSDARTYWEAIETQSLRPEIHNRSANAALGTRGVWLSLRKNT